MDGNASVNLRTMTDGRTASAVRWAMSTFHRGVDVGGDSADQPAEVRGRDDVLVDHDEDADLGVDELLGHVAPAPGVPDDGDGGSGEPDLGGVADGEELSILDIDGGHQGSPVDPLSNGESDRDQPVDLAEGAVGFVDGAGDGVVGDDEEPVDGVGPSAAHEGEEGRSASAVGSGSFGCRFARVGMDEHGTGVVLHRGLGNPEVEAAVVDEALARVEYVLVGHGYPTNDSH